MYKYIIMAYYYKLSILLPCCAKVPDQLYLKQMFCWEHKNQLQGFIEIGLYNSTKLESQ